MLKNWRTTLLGAITGLVMIIKGILTKDPLSVVEGVGIAITGALASDGHLVNEKVKELKQNDNEIFQIADSNRTKLNVILNKK